MRGPKPKQYGFEDMDVGEWLNIRAADMRRYVQALSRHRESTDRKYVCRLIGPDVYRIMRIY